MAKCMRCGASMIFAKKIKVEGGVICTSCSKALGLNQSVTVPLTSKNDIQVHVDVAPEVKPRIAKKEYFFLVHDLDEEFIEKYRKSETDKEDLWEGMSFNDIRENCYEGDKIYKYPDLDLYLEFKEATLDDNPALEVYLDDHMVGYVPKTKVKKTKKLLADDKVSWKAELYGGDYQYLKGNYVDEWFDKVNIRVTFTWSEEISEK